MKVKTLSLLAGAAAFAATSVASAGVTLDIVHSTGDDNAFLAANNLQSITIQAVGVPEGWATLGILGAGQNPWTVQTDSPDGFFNTAGFGNIIGGNSIWSARNSLVTTDPATAGYWDSGFSEYAQASWGLVAGPIGATAFHLDNGGNEVGVIGSVIEGSGAGAAAPGGPIDLVHVTWSADHEASGSISFALVDPLSGAQDLFTLEWSVGGPPVPAPGALALLGLAGLVGTRRRRN